MSSPTRKNLHGDEAHGSIEKRSKPYVTYSARAPEKPIQRFASSADGILGSAQKPDRAMQVFALIDCNNFFVSCERLFRPDLEHKPVIVLSSNDGCAISRSNEAKACGIPMGAAVFKYRHAFQQHGIVQFSANFELYGDISRRIIQVLTTITPRLEVYSVDESFLDLSELPITDFTAWGQMVRENILKWAGIPVSIGIASSKTLAKLASDRAKKESHLQGVLSLMDASDELRARYLQATPLESVWGVGWRLGPRLRAEGIGNAWQLSHMRPQRARQLMGTHGSRMVTELNGVSCLPLEREQKPVKSIAVTRTFGEDTNDIYGLEAALATFTSTAAFRLRRSQQMTHRVELFLSSNKHKPGYQIWRDEVILHTPTADTGLILSTVIDRMRRLHNPNVLYHRAGVTLHDFVPGNHLQVDLLGDVDVAAHVRSAGRMQAMDDINNRFGRGRVRFASEDLAKQWTPKQRLRSPRYTTEWTELPTCRIM